MTRTYWKHFRDFNRELKLFIFGSALMSVGIGFFGVLVNLRVVALGMSKTQAGDITGAFSFGMLIAAIPFAMLHSRAITNAAATFNTKALLMIATLGGALGLAGAGSLQQFAPLLISAIVLGFCVSAFTVISAPFVMSHAQGGARLYAFGLMGSIQIIATVFGNYVAGYSSDFFASFYPSEQAIGFALVLGAVMLTSACIPFALLSSSKTPSSIPTATLSLKHYFFPTQPKLYMILTLPGAVTALGAGITLPFLNLLLSERFQLNNHMIGIVFSLTSAATALGTLAGPLLVKHLGVVRTMTLTQLASIPFLLALIVTQNQAAAGLSLIFRGALMNLSNPMARAFQLEQVPHEEQPVMNALSMTAWTATTLLGSLLGGRLIEKFGFSITILISAGLYVVATLSCQYFWKRLEH